MSNLLKIGISACFLHPDPQRAAFGKKTLHYVEQSMSHWVMSGGALPFMVPAVTGDTARGVVSLADYVGELDGLVLHGGVDMSPTSYGEQPMRPEWRGDRLRDDYEIALTRAFVAAGKPVFGICRGLQLINVAFGGALYQDIETQHAGARQHRDAEVYDHLVHAMKPVAGSRLEALLRPASIGKQTGDSQDLAPTSSYTINSIHHQGIKHLAPDFLAEAHSVEDGVIEAIRWTGPSFVAAVQWHPEFHRPELGVLDDSALLRDFLAEAARVRDAQRTARV
jgi:putative glutamine amidotransferase